MERSRIHPISCSGDDRVPPTLVVPTGNPGIPRRGFSFGERQPAAFIPGLCVGDREGRADCQCGELIDRIAAGAPVRQLLFVEALGHRRMPFAGYRPDHRAGIELATIDAHRAAEAVTDLRLGLERLGIFSSYFTRLAPQSTHPSGMGSGGASIRPGADEDVLTGQLRRILSPESAFE
jgi:hypothetical protein